jgi:hypothetical protein
LKVVPAAADTLNVVKDSVVGAAHAGAEKTQEVYNEYVAPTAAAGKKQRFSDDEGIAIILF